MRLTLRIFANLLAGMQGKFSIYVCIIVDGTEFYLTWK